MSIHTLNRNNYRSNIKVKTYNNTYTNSFCQSKLTADKFQYKTKISFNKSEGPSQETLDYINKERKRLAEKGEKLSSLSQLRLSKIEDIAAGIKLFEDFSIYDLAHIGSNFDSILLQRGCAHQCSHCGSDAENKITTMDWTNLQAIAEGMGTLKERLGFNIFTEKSQNGIFPFTDSDPMHYKAPVTTTEPNGETTTSYKNIYDAVNLLYEKTGSKSLITTAGWDKHNQVSQTAALEFIKNPKPLKKLSLSVSPFHHHMEMAKHYDQRSKSEKNPEKIKLWKEKASEMTEKYTDTIADNLATLWPLINNIPLDIILLYDENDDQSYSLKKAIGLVLSINNKTKEKLQNQFSQKKFDSLIKYRAIDYVGRAANLIPKEKLSTTIKNLDDRFFDEMMKKRNQNIKLILNRPIRIDLDGSIVVNLLQNSYATPDIRSYLVRLTGKKLALPHTQTIKTDKITPEILWPSIDVMKELTGQNFSLKYLLKHIF